MLTPRETEVMKLCVKGMTAREVGDALSISSRTVEVHKRNIMKKFGVSNTLKAIRAFEDWLVRKAMRKNP